MADGREITSNEVYRLEVISYPAMPESEELIDLGYRVGPGSTYPRPDYELGPGSTYPRPDYELGPGSTYPRPDYELGPGSTYPR